MTMFGSIYACFLVTDISRGGVSSKGRFGLFYSFVQP